MKLIYKNLSVDIEFAQAVNFDLPVPCIFRSIIGFQLKKMLCLAPRDTKCEKCLYNSTCVYALAFETLNLPSADSAAATDKREKLSHPTIINCVPFIGRNVKKCTLKIRFLGEAIKYIPYYFEAIKRGESSGILKARTPYKVVCGLDAGEGTKTWEFLQRNENAETIKETAAITLETPFRFNLSNKKMTDFNELDFILILHRRAQMLCSMFGSNDFDGNYRFENKWENTERDFYTVSYTRWSSRQKQEVNLSGLVGKLLFEGEFCEYEKALLDFAQIFNAGKNTNFGFGKISCKFADNPLLLD